METRFARHLINGEWDDGGVRESSFNPATGEVIGEYVKAGADEANRAIAAAKDVFDNTDWRFDRKLRARVLNSMADAFEARSEELVEILALENGKIKPEARFEVGLSGPTLRFNAALALTDTGRAAEAVKGRMTMVVRQAAGVSGVIAPWNSPVALVLRSLAPALAAGTTVVVNLPTATAQTNALIAEIVAQTPGLPAGVVNFLIGGRESAGAIIKSPDVPIISFTGSTKTGKSISADAAVHLKRMGLELGGKTPMLVFEDADLDEAIPIIVRALTTFAGQFCMTGSRVLVASAIASAVRERLAAALRAVKVGPAADPSSEMGAIIDKPNVSRIDAVVENAISAGATVIVRGGPVTEGELAKGAFYRPTLLEVTDSQMDIVQQEVFGPVLTMQVFESESEAIAMANDSEYGLSAAVFSTDVDLPLRVALQLESGTVWVNDWAVLYDQSEEGGFKSSGQGRMRGLAVIDDFIEYKHIALRPGHTDLTRG
ncbi:aldehyde dehydrogenase [Microbacterium sp. MYb54]|nr:aldehyde dehydrogenase [Microbacterium sp. MYb43]PQZ76912.1 aldehyde dehydrogenase [Microbacterium sp. MYb40]PRB23305.1 aldehyde dehydrogenase [Microbacterium sp. MYb54]PRB28209.1 aldehyde dehydrogenase [Microbacterium sp. MYb50]PRB66260.1 aldehyde dehydrogenase [Microbacterium sp. MYb24]PRB72957.1 aldehyde dehydrogenase [Microbacterium sp. MYb32]